MRRISRILGPCAATLAPCAAIALIAGCRADAKPVDGESTTAKTSSAMTTAEIALNKTPNPNWSDADDDLIAPIWTGNSDKGQLYTPLWRGALPGIEELVYAPPNGDCRRVKATVRVDWDVTQNTVHFLIKGRGFVRHPSVHRTAGVDFFPNQFHPAPSDFDNGAYRLWIVEAATTNKEKLWYAAPGAYPDCQFGPPCGPLRATQYTAPSQPPDAPIELVAPTFSITGTHQFQPDESGFFSHSFTNQYNSFTNEGGLYSRDWVTFAPQDLCQAHPGPVFPKSQFRPVASPWQPPDQAPKWNEFLAANLAFDLHAEEATDPNVLDGNLTYVYSGISVVGNMPTLQGGVPNGAHAVLTGAIINVQPPIELVPGGNGLGCAAYMNEARPWAGYPGTPVNYCLIPPPTCP
jgi:hypothetical protein